MAEPILNVAHLLQNSTVNGPGLRDVIWVQGCSICCEGCINQKLWSYRSKYLIPVDKLLQRFTDRKGFIDGITISGGEPTEQAYALSYLLKGMKEQGFTTVVYTGHIYEELVEHGNEWIRKLLDYTDILIDGPFIKEQHTIDYNWRGSSNQRLILLSTTFNLTQIHQNPTQREIHIFVKNANQTVIQTGIF